MAIQPATLSDEADLLSRALLRAGKSLGLTQVELGRAIGKDRSSLRRGLDPDSKPGELALLIIRSYRSLFVLVGGGSEDIRHWMRTENLHTGGIPAAQIQTVQGLNRVVEYLDAIRGKV